MALFGESIRRIAQKMQSCEEWIEMVRDLRRPIDPGKPPVNLQMRWAKKEDLFAINALEGFVKETDLMEDSLRKGDRCLLMEDEKHLRAFAWVTFRDYKMALWYTLKLPPGWSYLEYIFVHPVIAGQGVGSYLLGALLSAVRDHGYSHMVAGMYSDWDISIRLHTRMGFHVHRRLTQCKILNILPTRPREG
ncbi:MAG: GNAT family N-acetyltransferase [Desulfatiglandales bacterium]